MTLIKPPAIIHNATSIKQLETLTYRGIPVIMMPDLPSSLIRIVYIPYSYDGEEGSYSIKSTSIFFFPNEITAQYVENEVRVNVEHSINQAISDGTIMAFDQLEPDYEFLDHLFFKDLKRMYSYITQKNEEYLSNT
jgi:hypothetical protein